MRSSATLAARIAVRFDRSPPSSDGLAAVEHVVALVGAEIGASANVKKAAWRPIP
jgi:hypothetical protein